MEKDGLKYKIHDAWEKVVLEFGFILSCFNNTCNPVCTSCCATCHSQHSNFILFLLVYICFLVFALISERQHECSTSNRRHIIFDGVLCVSLLQIRVDGSSLALQYETVQAVDNGPILRDMAFSSDFHYLYVMSETQVRETHANTHTHYLLCP